MSDESKFFKKCKCSHCSLPVSFPLEMLGKTIECPHCKCQTLLTETREPDKVVELPPSARPAEVKAPAEARGLVHNLEYIGEVFLSLGFFGMIAAGLAAAFMHYSGAEVNQTLWLVALAIAVFLPGLFIKYLFFALAEIIRLLRSIEAGTRDPFPAKPAKATDSVLPAVAPVGAPAIKG